MLISRSAAAMAVAVTLVVMANPSPATATTCQDVFRINVEAIEGFAASFNEAATGVGAIASELASSNASDETLDLLVALASVLKTRSDQAQDFAELQVDARDQLC